LKAISPTFSNVKPMRRVKGQQVIDFKVFCNILDELAGKRGLDKEAVYKMVAGKAPGLTGVTVSRFVIFSATFSLFCEY